MDFTAFYLRFYVEVSDFRLNWCSRIFCSFVQLYTVLMYLANRKSQILELLFYNFYNKTPDKKRRVNSTNGHYCVNYFVLHLRFSVATCYCKCAHHSKPHGISSTKHFFFENSLLFASTNCVWGLFFIVEPNELGNNMLLHSCSAI